MSAYSDWKCGAISGAAYSSECRKEAARDKAFFDRYDRETEEDDEEDNPNCIDCEHFKDYKCGDQNTIKCCECPYCIFETTPKEKPE